MCQGSIGSGLMLRLGRPIRVSFMDKINSLLMGQIICMNQIKQEIRRKTLLYCSRGGDRERGR
jgi:hypothetical protein